MVLREANSSSGNNRKDIGDSSTGNIRGHDDTTGRKVSDIWKHFSKSADKRKAVCSICDKELSYSGGTTNLRDHLEEKHSVKYSTTSKPTTLCTTMDDFVKRMKCSEACAKNITDRVSQMIVQDLRPIRIVECEGFRTLLSYLEPGYTLPSRKNFVSNINHKFETCKDKLKTHLEAEAPCVSITTDIWTSMATEAYMTVTVHYIDASWKM